MSSRIKIIESIKETCDPKCEPNRFKSVGKLLCELEDKNAVELSYMLKSDNEIYLCMPSQVGCSIKCVFCINKNDLFVKNLKSKEIINMIRLTLGYLKLDLKKLKVLGVMFMGCGEPSLNYIELKKAIIELNRLDNCAVAITTTGANLRGLYHLIDSDIEFSLQISLHSVFDYKRKKLIPFSIKVRDLIDLGKYYATKKNSMVDINYVLIKNVNDSLKEINKLKNILDPKVFTIRISKLNKIKDFKPQTKLFSMKVVDMLKKSGFSCRYFESSGGNIVAGCGQLKTKLKN